MLNPGVIIAALFLLTSILCSPIQAQLHVIDDIGHGVTLKNPANRIVTLSPHTTELILALGESNKLAAVADHDDYPADIKHLPRISSLGGLDRERLLVLNPDLVVAWASGNNKGDIQWLKNQDIPVYQSEPDRLADIADSLEKLGILSGVQEKGVAAANQFRKNLAGSCRIDRSKPLRSAYYEIWPNPPMTIGGQHWLNEVLNMAGLYNVFRDQSRQIFTVEPEAKLSRPAAVYITPYDSKNSDFTSVRLIKPDPLLSRPGPRITEGIRKLCTSL